MFTSKFFLYCIIIIILFESSKCRIEINFNFEKEGMPLLFRQSSPFNVTKMQYELKKMNRKQLYNVYASNSSTFQYYDQVVKFSDFKIPYIFINASIGDIMKNLGPPYMYYSGNLMQSQFTSVLEHVRGFRKLNNLRDKVLTK